MKSVVLKPLSLIYRGSIYLRNKGYDKGIFPVNKLNIPVVSVGNITAGGSGKTPLVRYLCERLLERGHKPAVLTRGYLRSEKGDITFKSPPGADIDADSVGDEPYMLSLLLPDVIFGIGADRFRLGAEAIEKYNPDVFILDDGFQHRKLHRDLDIVVVDTFNSFDNESCLPAGMLREPLSNLSRADIIILKDFEITETNKRLFERLKYYAPHAEIFKSTIYAGQLKSLSGVDSEPPENLNGRRVYAFCGIGNPDGFKKTLIDLGAEIVRFRAFRDHHHYTEKDIKKMSCDFSSSNTEIAVTTMKDNVKLQRLKISFPVFGLDIHYNFDCEDGERFISSVFSIIKK